jgi:PAS domain S-box-containing protein
MAVSTEMRAASPVSLPGASVRPLGRAGLSLLLAASAAAGSAGLRWALAPITGDAGGLIVFVPAIVMSAWYGGFWPGALASLLAVLAGDLLWSRPGLVFGVGSLAEGLGLTLLAVTGLLTSALMEAVHRGRRAARQEAARLAETQDRYRLMVECVEDYAIVMLDPHGIVVSSNEGAEKILGYGPVDILNRHYCRFFTNDDIQRRLPERDLETAASWGRLEAEGWRLRQDGSAYWTASVITPVKDRSGRLCGFSLVMRDVTEAKSSREELTRSEQQLRSLASHLHTVRENERSRIAREIHDELGQELTCLKMDVAWLQNNTTNQPELEEKVAAMRRSVEQSLQSVRRISAELRPRVLDELGLAAAVEWHVQEFADRTGIHCVLPDPLADVTVDPERSTALYRILQEALTNVARHAGATRVDIDLREDDEGLLLQVRDNGCGIPADQGTRLSLGLFGMRERAIALGGRLTIDSSPGCGTIVRVRMPRKEAA